MFNKRFLFAGLLLLSLEMFAENKAEHEVAHEIDEPFRVAFYLGHGYIPSADFGSNPFAIIPTYGLDFQYWFSHKLGVGFKTDIEIAQYLVPNADATKEIIRHNPLILALPIIYSPFGHGLTVVAAPAIELEGHQNFGVFRMGLGYEIEVGKHFDFGTEVIYDLKNGNINSLTWAFGVGKRFY